MSGAVGFVEWAGSISGVLALIGIGFAASRAFERFVSKPRRETLGLSKPEALLPELNIAWSKPEISHLSIVGYSVHSLYDPLNPLVTFALKHRADVRLLMLDPHSHFLRERAFSESTRTDLSANDFLARSQRSIRRTAEAILEAVETVKYQNNLKESNCSLRVYSGPPVYRAVLSNLGGACSSYLEDLDRPSRDFLMTDPRIDSERNEREVAKATNWVDYLTKFRSRPFLTEAVLFDMYDTLLDVDEGRQRAHQSSLAADCGLSTSDFLAQWERTRESSNLGAYRSTTERFEEILRESERTDDTLAADLAAKEHQYLREAYSISPIARLFLTEFRARGYRLALVSNCSVSALHVISSTGLAALVDVVALSFEVGCIKPDPKTYLSALHKLNVDASRAVFIGDGADDELAGAHALGIRTIQATWYRRGQRLDAYKQAASFAEAARLIDPEASWAANP